MDQFISGLGKKNNALFIDCKTLDYKHIPLNLADAKIIICDTKKRRALEIFPYNQRAGRSVKLESVYLRSFYRITLLRDVTKADFLKNTKIIFQQL